MKINFLHSMASLALLSNSMATFAVDDKGMNNELEALELRLQSVEEKIIADENRNGGEG